MRNLSLLTSHFSFLTSHFSLLMIDLLLEPLKYPFMWRGLLAAVMVGIVCSVVGSYMVLRGMAFLGDALAHTILPGVALGYIINGQVNDNIFWWALATGIMASLGIGFMSRQGQIKEDTAIGVVFAAMFALGVAMISTVRNSSTDLNHFLFGDVLGVSNRDLILIAVFGSLVLLLVFLFYKEFLVISFDPILAETLRIRPTFYHYLLLVMIPITIVISLQTVGIALMVAMLVTPAATASMLTRRLPIMMGLGALIGATSSASGLYISYYVNVASGAAMVLVCTTMFMVAFFLAPGRGWLWQYWRGENL